LPIQPGLLLLDRYRIDARLGAGGMGEVWSAGDELLDRRVAVKALGQHLVEDDAARARFRREAALAGSLIHEHVVAIHDAGTQGETMVIVMELVDGGNLATRLRDGPPSFDDAVGIATELLSGLAAAHDAGLVHRDVKPANVMFTPDGTTKLTDFGLARPAAAQTASSAAFYGSAPYIAPERARGHRAVRASDVYAAGCILYEMLTGICPFLGETPAVTIARHLQYEPPHPSTVVPGIPQAIDAVVMRALAKEAAVRYPDAGAMLTDLRSAVDSGRVGPVTVTLRRRLSVAERWTVRREPDVRLSPQPPARHVGRWLTLSAGALVLGLALVGAWLNAAGA
jgi:serine/threonine protein kinase